MARRAEERGDLPSIDAVAQRTPVRRAGTPGRHRGRVRVPLLRRRRLHHRSADQRQRRLVPVTARGGRRLAPLPRERVGRRRARARCDSAFPQRRGRAVPRRPGRTRCRCPTRSHDAAPPRARRAVARVQQRAALEPALEHRHARADGAARRVADAARTTSGRSTCSSRRAFGDHDRRDRRDRATGERPTGGRRSSATLLAATDQLLDGYRVDDDDLGTSRPSTSTSASSSRWCSSSARTPAWRWRSRASACSSTRHGPLGPASRSGRIAVRG